tara:strand:+ start:1456 stop:2562 length:1107 start_codon:yes stop_codon:yes gene_type:complete
MFVNKYKINNTLLSGNTDYSINLPISQNEGFSGQQEIVNKKFVEVEVENSINEPYDYEKIKILPKNDITPIKTIRYNLTFLYSSKKTKIKVSVTGTGASLTINSILFTSAVGTTVAASAADLVTLINASTSLAATATQDNPGIDPYLYVQVDIPGAALTTVYGTNTSGNAFNTNLTWENLGLTDNDLKFRKKAFSKSFLRLDFYDSDVATRQNYLSFVTLYPKFERFTPINTIATKYTDSVEFELGNTVIDRNKNGEGFSLYYFKDEIFPKPLPPKYLYMRATFNNAKSGISTGLMSSSDPNLPVDELMKTTKDITTLPKPKNNMYTRYVLTREVDGYFYDIDMTYSNNVTTPSIDIYNVELYQISAI